MADVCPSYDDRLTEAARWCPAEVAAAQARLLSTSSTTAGTSGNCPAAGVVAEV